MVSDIGNAQNLTQNPKPKISTHNTFNINTDESGFREQPPCRHPRSLNPDWSLNPDSFSSRKFPYQKSEASKSRPASKYQFSKYRLICILIASHFDFGGTIQVQFHTQHSSLEPISIYIYLLLLLVTQFIGIQ